MSLRRRSTLLIALFAGLFTVGATFSAAAMPGKNGEQRQQQRQSLKRAQSTGALDRERDEHSDSIEDLAPKRAASSSALGRAPDGKSLRIAGQRGEDAHAHDEGARPSAAFSTLVINGVKAAKQVLAKKRAQGLSLTKLEESVESGSELWLAHGEESKARLEDAIQSYREDEMKRPRFDANNNKLGTVAAAELLVPGVKAGRIFVNGSPNSKPPLRQSENNPRYQSPSKFSGDWNHAEQNVLGDIADALDPGGKGREALKGVIHLRVEQKACSACRTGLSLDTKTDASGVIKQFSKQFPNITLVVSDMEERELLIVRDGNMVGL